MTAVSGIRHKGSRPCRFRISACDCMWSWSTSACRPQQRDSLSSRAAHERDEQLSARPGPAARGGRILGTRAVRGAGCSRAWRVGRAGRPSVRRSPRRLRAQPARPAAQRSPCEPRAPRQARERRSGLLRHRRTVSLVAVSAGGQRTVRGTARWRRRLAHSWGDAGGC